MWDRDTWLEVIDVLRAHRVRTLLTAFGVLWGILMLMVMLGFGNGLRVGVSRSMSSIASNSMFIWGRRTTKPFGGFRAGRSIRLVNEDVGPMGEAPGVEQVCPRVQLGGYRSGNLVARGDKSAPFRVMGDVPEITRFRPMDLPAGRFLNAFDLSERRKVAVVGVTVRDELFRPGEDPIGEFIHINRVPFEVVGVVKTRTTGDRGDRDDSTIHIPISTFQQAFNYANRIGYVALLIDQESDSEQVLAAARGVLASRHRFDQSDQNAIGSWNSAAEFTRIQRMFMGIEGFVWFVGIMTLLSGVVGVSNIMLISVKERTREIGVRRALGARPAAVVAMVMQESMALTGLAGMLGIAGGVAALEVIARFVGEGTEMFSAPYVSFWTVIIATGVLVLSGLLAGLLPARVALSRSTAEAIRV